jgi:hypothetical protein
MKLNYFLLLILAMFVVSSCQKEEKHDDGILIHNCSTDNICNYNTNLSDLFSEYKLIQLETNDDCLIGGRSNIIKKHNGSYYVSSLNDILVFDKSGKFVNKLSKSGSGSDEYAELADFDVAQDNDEILVASDKSVFRYKLGTFELIDKVEFPFFITNIKSIGDSEFIAATPDDLTYKLCNYDGKVIKSYFKKDLALVGRKPIRFVKIDNLITCQLESSNQAVTFNLKTKEFGTMKILASEKDLETVERDRAAYEKYGEFDYSMKVMDEYIGLLTFRKIGNNSIVIFRYPDMNFGLSVCDGKTNKIFKYDVHCKGVLSNDITEAIERPIYNTIIASDSDDSFIFTLEGDNELNPQILDVTKISL